MWCVEWFLFVEQDSKVANLPLTSTYCLLLIVAPKLNLYCRIYCQNIVVVFCLYLFLILGNSGKTCHLYSFCLLFYILLKVQINTKSLFMCKEGGGDFRRVVVNQNFFQVILSTMYVLLSNVLIFAMYIYLPFYII